MKKIATLFLLMALALLISGCGEHTDAESSDGAQAPRFSGFQADDVDIMKDEVTGCKYLIYLQGVGQGGAGGITPLMEADGTQDCE